jgi:Gram-negative bacterial TonB protein C-terminal
MNAPLSRRPCMILCGIVAMFFVSATAVAQETLAKAKALYDAAAYEEALTLLAPEQVPEAQQYKALCMLALGRSQDATGAVETLVSATPTFEPSADDLPPRFVTLVAEAKKKLLPGIARRTFTEGREQFRSGDHEQALRKFDLVLTLTSSPLLKETPDAEDLRTLASGFIDLARASAAARPEPKAPEPPKVVEAAQAAAPSVPPDVVQPTAIRQPIPSIPSGVNGLGSPTASVRVEIGTDGKVVGAVMQQSAHPLYDRMVLQAARDWLYTPAMLNGRPVPSEKVVTIQLR